MINYLLPNQDISKRNVGLDLLRAVAIVLVLVSHGRKFLEGTPLEPLVHYIKATGFFGVELFFVLSGFLIGGIICDKFGRTDVGWKTLTDFWLRRWFRTLPAYYVVVVLYLLVSFSDIYPKGFSWRYFFFLQNFNVRTPPFFSSVLEPGY